jgi:hypothetical protein
MYLLGIRLQLAIDFGPPGGKFAIKDGKTSIRDSGPRNRGAEVFMADTAAQRFYMTYSLLRERWGKALYPGIAVDLLQCFPANRLYGGRNRFRAAV